MAIVFSIMNIAGSIGSALFPSSSAGWETTHNWNHVMLAIAMIYLAAAVCWLLLNPTARSSTGRPAESRAGSLYCGSGVAEAGRDCASPRAGLITAPALAY